MTDSQLHAIVSYVTQQFTAQTNSSHNLDHLNRVWQNAHHLAHLTHHTDPQCLRLLKAVCYLHDLSYATPIPLLFQYFTEVRRTNILVTPLLRQLQVPSSDIVQITHAITHHPWSIPFRRLNPHQDYLTQILQDADSIDYFHPLRLRVALQWTAQHYLTFMHPLINWFAKSGQDHIRLFLNLPQAVAYAQTQYSK